MTKHLFKKGHKQTEETKKKISQSHMGIGHTLETKKRLSEIGKTKIGKKSNAWKSGKLISSQGYVLILNRTHPCKQYNNYIFEHRLIMEQHIGRYLKPKEVVDHLNGIRNDNRIENLKLYENSSEHFKSHWRKIH